MASWSRHVAAAFALLSLIAMTLAPARAGSDIGIVVLHGKQGMAGDRPTAPFLQALRDAGYATQAPTLCWSRSRIYDTAFSTACARSTPPSPPCAPPGLGASSSPA